MVRPLLRQYVEFQSPPNRYCTISLAALEHEHPTITPPLAGRELPHSKLVVYEHRKVAGLISKRLCAPEHT